MTTTWIAPALAAVLLLAGCSTKPEMAPPQPPPPPAPSEAVLPQDRAAQAEAVYRTVIKEWVRLEREGGADEPSQVLRDHAAEGYLETVMLYLRDQKAERYTVGGPDPVLTVVRPHPDDTTNTSDPITLQVCEDAREGWQEDASGRSNSELMQGSVQVKQIDGRLKVFYGATEAVDRCTL